MWERPSKQKSLFSGICKRYKLSPRLPDHFLWLSVCSALIIHTCVQLSSLPCYIYTPLPLVSVASSSCSSTTTVIPAICSSCILSLVRFEFESRTVNKLFERCAALEPYIWVQVPMCTVITTNCNPRFSSPTIWETWNQLSNQAEQYLLKTTVDCWQLLLLLQMRNWGNTSGTNVELLLRFLVLNPVNK